MFVVGTQELLGVRGVGALINAMTAGLDLDDQALAVSAKRNRETGVAISTPLFDRLEPLDQVLDVGVAFNQSTKLHKKHRLRIGCAVVKGCGFEVAKLKILIAWLAHFSLVSALRL